LVHTRCRASLLPLSHIVVQNGRGNVACGLRCTCFSFSCSSCGVWWSSSFGLSAAIRSAMTQTSCGISFRLHCRTCTIRQRKNKEAPVFRPSRLKTNCLFIECPHGNDLSSFPGRKACTLINRRWRKRTWHGVMGQASSFDDLLSGKTLDAGYTGGTSLTSLKYPDVCPCPFRVLKRRPLTSLLVVKRASGPDHPCATDFVYTLKRRFCGALFLHVGKGSLT